MREDVLPKGGTVLERTQGLHDFGVEVMDACVEGSLLASLTNALVDKVLGLLIELLDARGGCARRR